MSIRLKPGYMFSCNFSPQKSDRRVIIIIIKRKRLTGNTEHAKAGHFFSCPLLYLGERDKVMSSTLFCPRATGIMQSIKIIYQVIKQGSYLLLTCSSYNIPLEGLM